MKKTNYLNRLTGAAALAAQLLLLASCDQEADHQPKGRYESGVFTIDEGNFNRGNGSVSFYNRQTKTAEADIFKKVNNRPTGDVIQDLVVYNDKAYIVANNSGKVEVADANTFQSIATVEGLALPRYFAAGNQKGYVSEWVGFSGNGRVSVIDLGTNRVTKTIPTGELPEQVLLHNNKLYVANSEDNTLTVINTTTDAVEATIEVGDAPNGFVVDANNKLWVLCGGNKEWLPDYSDIDEAASTAGSLVRLNPVSQTVESRLSFGSRKDSPAKLSTNNSRNQLYYTYQGKVFQIDITATALPANPLINRDFYGFGVDPAGDILYGSPETFTANSKVIRYNASGVAIDSFQAGIGTNGFLFR
ncbi:MAG: YncE family protein [Adhaeribacter sp.]